MKSLFSKGLTLLAPSLILVLSVYLVVLNVSLMFLGWGSANFLAVLAALATLIAAARLEMPKLTESLTGREALYALVWSLLVSAYGLAWYWLKVPPDYWLDFPQQSLMAQQGLVFTHPYIPEVQLGGQYGRNLMVAGLSRLFSASLLLTLILSNVTFQFLSALQCFVLFRGQSKESSYFAVPILFLGLGVGAWAGLMDHFFHHAALAHLLLLGAWFLLTKRSYFFVFPFLALGIVFPLYVCLLIPIWAIRYFPLKKQLAALLLASALVPLQGGPLQQIFFPKKQALEQRASQEQSFSVVFPKEELFQINVQPWIYWRTTVGLTSLSVGPKRRDYKPVGYSYILSWKVLQLHWLPLWLLPLSLVLGRKETEAKSWLAFGTLAYVTPSLVNFGPVYEAEYYRWELAAAVGFGSALVIALSKHKKLWPLLLLCCWPGLYKLAIMDWRLELPREEAWVEHHATALRLRPGEYLALKWLGKEKGQTDSVWRDLLPDFDDNRSINGDATTVGFTGLQMSGKAFPLRGDFIGRPPFRPTLNAKAFWLFEDPAALERDKIDWLVTHKDRDFSSFAELAHQSGDVKIWRVQRYKSKETRKTVGGDWKTPKSLVAGSTLLDKSWSPEFSEVLTQTWEDADKAWSSKPIYQSRKDGLMLCAPELPGDYTLSLSSGQEFDISIRAPATLNDLILQKSSLDENPVGLSIGNSSTGELRLHNAYFALTERGEDGKYKDPVALHFQEIFIIGPKGQASLQLPLKEGVKAAPESRLSLFIRAREGEVFLPLR